MMAADFKRQMTLLQVSDSAFPSGSFAFSNGLETLVTEKRISGAEDLKLVLEHHVLPRWLEFDRWFLCHAHSAAADPTGISRLDRLFSANTVTETLLLASQRIGKATLAMHLRLGTAGAKELRALVRQEALAGHAPVIQGVLLKSLGLSCEEASASALYTTLSASVSAAVRLGTVGALEAQTVLSKVAATGAESLTAPLPEQPYASRPLIDIAAMRHVANPTRLFAA